MLLPVVWSLVATGGELESEGSGTTQPPYTSDPGGASPKVMGHSFRWEFCLEQNPGSQHSDQAPGLCGMFTPPTCVPSSLSFILQNSHHVECLQCARHWPKLFRHTLYSNPYPSFIEELNQPRDVNKLPEIPYFVGGEAEIWTQQPGFWLSSLPYRPAILSTGLPRSLLSCPSQSSRRKKEYRKMHEEASQTEAAHCFCPHPLGEIQTGGLQLQARLGNAIQWHVQEEKQMWSTMGCPCPLSFWYVMVCTFLL